MVLDHIYIQNTVLPQIILFDLDGTLVDTSNIVVDAYYQAMKELGYDPPSRKLIASLAGKSTYETAKGMGAEEKHYAAVDQFFWKYFSNYAETVDDVPLMNNVKEVLSYVGEVGIRCGIVTSNESRSANLLMKKAGLDKYFETYVGKEDLEERKPSPEPLYLALKQMNVSEDSNAWFVGDTVHDVIAAKTGGLTSIAIPQSFTYDKVKEANPDHLLTKIIEMKDLLVQKNSN